MKKGIIIFFGWTMFDALLIYLFVSWVAQDLNPEYWLDWQKAVASTAFICFTAFNFSLTKFKKTNECEHPYWAVKSKCGYDKCLKCGEVLSN
jgi:hypothetical protein